MYPSFIKGEKLSPASALLLILLTVNWLLELAYIVNSPLPETFVVNGIPFDPELKALATKFPLLSCNSTHKLGI